MDLTMNITMNIMMNITPPTFPITRKLSVSLLPSRKVDTTFMKGGYYLHERWILPSRKVVLKKINFIYLHERWF